MNSIFNWYTFENIQRGTVKFFAQPTCQNLVKYPKISISFFLLRSKMIRQRTKMARQRTFQHHFYLYQV